MKRPSLFNHEKRIAALEESGCRCNLVEEMSTLANHFNDELEKVRSGRVWCWVAIIWLFAAVVGLGYILKYGSFP